MKTFTEQELIENVSIINDFIEADIYDNENSEIKKFLNFSYQKAALRQFVKENTNEDENVKFQVHDNKKTYFKNLKDKELKHKLIEDLQKFVIITATHEKEQKTTENDALKASETFKAYYLKDNIEQAAQYIAEISQILDINEVINNFFSEKKQKEIAQEREQQQSEQKKKELQEKKERKKAKQDEKIAQAMQEQLKKQQEEKERREREEKEKYEKEQVKQTKIEELEDFVFFSNVGQTIKEEIERGNKKIQYVIILDIEIYEEPEEDDTSAERYDTSAEGYFTNIDKYDNHNGAYIIEIAQEHRTDTDFVMFKTITEIYKNKELLKVILFKSFTSIIINEDKTFSTCSCAENLENM